MKKILNPSRFRYYGLNVNDRVRFVIRGTNHTLYGTVVELGFMDNNRVHVLWDGDTEPSDAVAECVDRVNEQNEVIDRYSK